MKLASRSEEKVDTMILHLIGMLAALITRSLYREDIMLIVGGRITQLLKRSVLTLE
jgi:hypothetical protein